MSVAIKGLAVASGAAALCTGTYLVTYDPITLVQDETSVLKRLPTTLRDRCKDAYDKDSSNDTSRDDKPKSDEVLKYCLILGS